MSFIGVELFSGSGGMSLGAKQSGINVKLAVENDPHAIASYKLNFPESKIQSIDIRKLKEVNINKQNFNSILFGGPPCQGFSSSNQKNRSRSNSMNWLFLEFVRLLKNWKPDWVVLENVKGILELEQGMFVDEIYKQISNLGYTLEHAVVNAADFGVPQRRNRIFIIGSLHGIKFRFPQIESVSDQITVKEAIDDLPIIENGNNVCTLKYRTEPHSIYSQKMRNGDKTVSNNIVTSSAKHILERYSYIPQGGNWQDIPEKLMSNYKDRNRCHTGIYRRLSEDQPSVVIGNYRKNMLVHPTQNRGLSVREAARLQSFPDWFKFSGSIGFQQQQVGNAVPPLLAKAIFTEIIKYE